MGHLDLLSQQSRKKHTSHHAVLSLSKLSNKPANPSLVLGQSIDLFITQHRADYKLLFLLPFLPYSFSIISHTQVAYRLAQD